MWISTGERYMKKGNYWSSEDVEELFQVQRHIFKIEFKRQEKMAIIAAFGFAVMGFIIGKMM